MTKKIQLAHAEEEGSADKTAARKARNDIGLHLLPTRQEGAIETQQEDNLSDILDSDYDDPDIEEDISRFVAKRALYPPLDNSTALGDQPIVTEKTRQNSEFVDNDKNIMDAFGNRYRPEYLNNIFDGWVTAVVIPTPSTKDVTRQAKATSVPFHGSESSPAFKSTETRPHSQSTTAYMTISPETKSTRRRYGGQSTDKARTPGTNHGRVSVMEIPLHSRLGQMTMGTENALREQWYRTCDFLDFK